jgi:hypothetical protein
VAGLAGGIARTDAADTLIGAGVLEPRQLRTEGTELPSLPVNCRPLIATAAITSALWARQRKDIDVLSYPRDHAVLGQCLSAGEDEDPKPGVHIVHVLFVF